MQIQTKQITSKVTINTLMYSTGRDTNQVTANNISMALKTTALELHYPLLKGIPVDWIDTQSLHCGGAMALALSGYSETQIQKIG